MTTYTPSDARNKAIAANNPNSVAMPARYSDRGGGCSKGIEAARSMAYCVCMPALCLVLGIFAAAIAAQQGAIDPGGSEPDRLYADRTNLASARRAAELWSGRLQRDPRDFDA